MNLLQIIIFETTDVEPINGKNSLFDSIENGFVFSQFLQTNPYANIPMHHQILFTVVIGRK